MVAFSDTEVEPRWLPSIIWLAEERRGRAARAVVGLAAVEDRAEVRTRPHPVAFVTPVSTTCPLRALKQDVEVRVDVWSGDSGSTGGVFSCASFPEANAYAGCLALAVEHVVAHLAYITADTKFLVARKWVVACFSTRRSPPIFPTPAARHWLQLGNTSPPDVLAWPTGKLAKFTSPCEHIMATNVLLRKEVNSAQLCISP